MKSTSSRPSITKSMRTLLILLLLTTLNLSVFAHFNPAPVCEEPNTEAASNAGSFRLYKTENMWTFIKLDTRNGRMWQVQFDVQDNNRFEAPLSMLRLVTTENESDNRFTLYTTKNMYTFILLDKIDGRTWQVQWSIEPENRVVIPIN